MSALTLRKGSHMSSTLVLDTKEGTEEKCYKYPNLRKNLT